MDLLATTFNYCGYKAVAKTGQPLMSPELQQLQPINQLIGLIRKMEPEKNAIKR